MLVEPAGPGHDATARPGGLTRMDATLEWKVARPFVATPAQPLQPRHPMIERHITFNVHPGRTADFERFFTERYATAMAQSPGFVRVDLLREADSLTRYQMSFRFDDLDASAGWRTSPVHQALQPDLTALFSTNEIQGYDVIA
jgi:antibiotic biosynthesis monooxygenase (ABM) superfamily enzyme